MYSVNRIDLDIYQDVRISTNFNRLVILMVCTRAQRMGWVDIYSLILQLGISFVVSGKLPRLLEG